MIVIFRCDANKYIGSGHLMRCLTIAGALKSLGHTSYFISNNTTPEFIELIKSNELNFIPINTHTQKNRNEEWIEDAELSAKIIRKLKPHWIVVDHYQLDYKWENTIGKICDNIIVLDDLSNRQHFCKLILDPGINANLKNEYRKNSPSDCTLMIGPKYPILRSEFDVEKNRLTRPLTIKKIQHVVIFFGGDDHKHHTINTIKSIMKIKKELSIDVIISISNQDKKEIEAYCKNNEKIKVHIATNEIAKLFSKADLSIGSGGTSTYERLYLQTPCLLKPIAKNQELALKWLKKYNLVELFHNQKQLKKIINKYLENGITPPQDIIHNGLNCIISFIVNDGFWLKDIEPMDIKRSYNWLQNNTLRDNFMMLSKPTLKSHFQYWRNHKSTQKEISFSICYFNEHIGTCGIKNIDANLGEAELWLYIGNEQYRSKGFGIKTISSLEKKASSQFNCRKIILHVSQHNNIALNLYCRLGYKIVGKVDSHAYVKNTGTSVFRLEKKL